MEILSIVFVIVVMVSIVNLYYLHKKRMSIYRGSKSY